MICYDHKDKYGFKEGDIIYFWTWDNINKRPVLRKNKIRYIWKKFCNDELYSIDYELSDGFCPFDDSHLLCKSKQEALKIIEYREDIKKY